MRLTFSEAADEWLAFVNASNLRPTTAAAYTGHIETHLKPALGRMRLDRITVDEIAKLVERMRTVEYRREVERRMGKTPTATTGYKAWTIRGVLVAASRTFDHVKHRKRWRGVNPVRDLDRSERPRLEDKERRILTRAELAAVIAATREQYRPIIATAAGLGTRLGETLGVRWRDVDLEAGTVSVRYQADRDGEHVELKTKRSRRVI